MGRDSPSLGEALTSAGEGAERLLALPALSDNYVWLWSRGEAAIAVDPGDAAPALAALSRHRLRLVAILLTHHHADHIGGAAALRAATGAPIHAPPDPRIPDADRRVGEGDRIELPALRAAFAVLATPGHTRTHVAFLGEGLLFCGDTLFSLGCGRIFEGTPAELHASLARLAALPPETRVCPAHEYTLANGRFALTVDPANPALRARLAEAAAQRERGEPTLPTTIGRERETNPFLRCSRPEIRMALGLADADPVALFAALRAAKDRFRG
ncbi:MAG: hydroxyacylglutathione hydrolase [Xanthomonadales bacterium]|nr:hydroxyacylglutathione hydrolase [Xanthomonadales bacterium]